MSQCQVAPGAFPADEETHEMSQTHSAGRRNHDQPDHRRDERQGRGIAEALRRRFWLIMLVAIAVFGGVAAWTLTADQRFTAGLSVYFDPRDPQALQTLGGGERAQASSPLMESEVRIIESRATAEEVVRQLMLFNDPEFFPGVVQDGPTTEPSETALRDATNRLRRAVSAERVGGTYVIEISATTLDAAKSQAIANTVADVYLTQQVNAKFAAADAATRWLETRVGDARAAAEADRAAVRAFRENSGLEAKTGGVLLSAEARAQIDRQISDARAQLAAVRARANAARRARAAGGGAGLTSPVASELRLRLAELTAREADIRRELGAVSDDPRLQAIAGERETLLEEIREEAGRIVAGLEAEVATLNAEIAALEDQKRASRDVRTENAEALAQLADLERRAEASRLRYETFLERLEGLADREGLTEPDARVVAYADLPTEPSLPRTNLQLALGALGAVLAGLLAGWLLEWTDPTLKSVRGAERAAGVRTLALMPRIRPGDRPKHLRDGSLSRIIVSEPRGGLAEVFRSIRASLRHPDRADTGKSVAVVSALEGEGKTTVTLGLGRSGALAGRRVLIIDADLRRASLTREIEEGTQSFSDPLGLSDVLKGTVEPKKAIRRDPMTALDYLPSFAFAADEADGMFEIPAFKALLDRLASDYDEIYVDTPPVFAVTDARDIARATDSTIFVVRFLQGRREAVENIAESFRAAGLRLAGLVLNMVPPSTIRRHRFDVNNPYGYFGFHSTSYSSQPVPVPATHGRPKTLASAPEKEPV